MKAPIAIDADCLEARLGGALPRLYRSVVQSQVQASPRKCGFDPKTLLVLNLELRETMGSEDAAGRFFLNGDGCGNYYFVELREDAEKVLLWSHDPPGAEDPGYSLATYLEEAEQEHRLDRPVPDGKAFICRTIHYAESILDPIGLDEWIAAVRATAGGEYLGYREGLEPFTRAKMRLDDPGLTAVVGQERTYIRFKFGRAMFDDSMTIRPIATALAGKLKAAVIGG